MLREVLVCFPDARWLLVTFDKIVRTQESILLFI